MKSERSLIPSGIVVTGLGEAIFDVLDGGAVLGGAPVNVAVHARQLLDALGAEGSRVAVATRVGNDALGRRFMTEAAGRGLDVSAVQVDPLAATGTAVVRIHDGEPSFELATKAAWDHLEFDDGLKRLAADTTAVCFGSLASRTPAAASAVESFMKEAGAGVRLFDVNARPPFVDASRIRRLCTIADILKVNEAELPIVAAALGLPAAKADEQLEAIRISAGLDLVVMTRGRRGAVAASAKGIERVQAASFAPAANADAIGAGDAFAAATLVGTILRWPIGDTLRLATFTAGFVASQNGATPVLPELPQAFTAMA